MSSTDTVPELTKAEYALFRDLVYQHAGINLGDQKMHLVRARLGKRMREGGFKSYREYYNFVKGDTSGQELTILIDLISTNTTYLFREPRHFDFLRKTTEEWIRDKRRKHHPIRIWSAGCSSGDEPYTIAMVMDDLARRHSGLEFKILATDISTRVLAKAREGIFEAQRVAKVPAAFKKRYLVPAREMGDNYFQIHPDLRRLVRFARLNLMDQRFPFRSKIDIIFCRNVMIYFDRPTQERLVARFSAVLADGGYLLIGHSESLNNVRHPLTYVMPTIYRK